MKVKELIEALGDMDQEAEVAFSYNYGDYWKTEVAAKVNQVSEGLVQYSDYHRMDKVIESYGDDVDEEIQDNIHNVVLLTQ